MFCWNKLLYSFHFLHKAMKWNNDSSNNDNAFDAFVLVSFFLFIMKNTTLSCWYTKYTIQTNIRIYITEIWAVGFSATMKLCEMQESIQKFYTHIFSSTLNTILFVGFAFYYTNASNYFYFNGIAPVFLYHISFLSVLPNNEKKFHQIITKSILGIKLITWLHL